MNENTESRVDPEFLRRIEVRRQQLRLTEEELAARAGMSPRYLRQLLEVGTGFDPDSVLRIAAALEMSGQELFEGRADAPPGQGGAADHPMLMTLTDRECWDRLGTHGIGRIALPVRPGPAVFPVNYSVRGHTVLYRTSPEGDAAAGDGSDVSFQVDHIDEQRHGGWSVLLVGRAEHVSDPETVGQLSKQAGEPWAGGVRDLWIRIVPDRISGRLIDLGSAAPTA